MFISSTVQFFRIKPNLLPENRPRYRHRQDVRECALRFRMDLVSHIETEGVGEARQVIDTDQHEGE